MIYCSSTEPPSIISALGDNALVDGKMDNPDYRIRSRLGFSIGIQRTNWNDMLSNKIDEQGYLASTLESIPDDIRILLTEDFLGRNLTGQVVLAGGRTRPQNYVGVINQILVACIATGTMWVPSANKGATVALLKSWNTVLFHKESHETLKIRPKKSAKLTSFSLDFETQDRVWWLSDMPTVRLGPKTATNLLRRFNTLARLAIATTDELETVEGIGANTASSIRQFLDGEVIL